MPYDKRTTDRFDMLVSGLVKEIRLNGLGCSFEKRTLDWWAVLRIILFSPYYIYLTAHDLLHEKKQAIMTARQYSTTIVSRQFKRSALRIAILQTLVWITVLLVILLYSVPAVMSAPLVQVMLAWGAVCWVFNLLCISLLICDTKLSWAKAKFFSVVLFSAALFASSPFIAPLVFEPEALDKIGTSVYLQAFNALSAEGRLLVCALGWAVMCVSFSSILRGLMVKLDRPGALDSEQAQVGVLASVSTILLVVLLFVPVCFLLTESAIEISNTGTIWIYQRLIVPLTTLQP